MNSKTASLHTGLLFFCSLSIEKAEMKVANKGKAC